MTVVGSLLEISQIEDAAEYEWRIPGSDTNRLELGEVLLSPFLSFAGWTFRVVFRRMYQSSVSSPLELFLSRYFLQSSASPLVHYWLGAKKGVGGREEEEIGRGRREPGLSVFAFHPWLPLSELQRRMGCSAPSSDTFSLILRFRTGQETDHEMRCLWKREEPEAAAERSTQTDFQDHEMRSLGKRGEPAATAERSTQTDFQDTLLLKGHFKKLLLNGSDHDVLLKVKDKVFKAHKNVLRARSPVFESMFQHDMRDQKVTIEDVDSDCFGEILGYVYTGEVENLTEANAMALYYSAVKYAFPALKRRCVDVLKASLSTSLVCDVIKLALTHREEELLESAMAYVTAHLEELMETTEWEQFLLSNPLQANKISVRALKRRRTSDCKKLGPCE